MVEYLSSMRKGSRLAGLPASQNKTKAAGAAPLPGACRLASLGVSVSQGQLLHFPWYFVELQGTFAVLCQCEQG